ncbi:DNA helicase/exodeoxyribonuclease V gamma subunit [Nicoletella semolina]|uniref:RecBCD enzyme subunit RecC n=1 Tax=Nicoletella semolina TaxID=271160 RepID=A0A4R2N8V4_9PAST|nr:exodeoxyribonuclease V subunit gamma [Nicoletella semolina]MDH2924452.1 exodeoxyribonuclease V subunit gamma [Nicoletella semolina]TCP17424.1 DNA helicase/exodeoxyribonuclease V gamma subunit [Nicoletella semolina]
MFTVYYSNQLYNHKDLLVNVLKSDPNPNPFEAETILVQSVGMAQWLQMQIAGETGIAANLQFPFPTSFLWQQYRLLFPELPKENSFSKDIIVWRLMRLLPTYLECEEFLPLAYYLSEQEQNQFKLYQLASKVADLFDQYLVYRPHWLIFWEQGNIQAVFNEINQSSYLNDQDRENIPKTLLWQSILWNALVEDVKKDEDDLIFYTSHRAYLQQHYLSKLSELSSQEIEKLPKRIFVFGISSMPINQLNILNQLGKYCHIHLFFTNPSKIFWGDSQEDRIIEKITLKQSLDHQDMNNLYKDQGNPLLSIWGKQGKEFLNLLIDNEPNEITFYTEAARDNLLNSVKYAILNYEYQSSFEIKPKDGSIQIHSCHSKMREVEVLHNYLLSLFEEYPNMSPNDIIVLSPDIDSYTPYINAVFECYQHNGKNFDKRYIPFSLSDQKLKNTNPIIASFLTLLTLKESHFNVEKIYSLLDVTAVREKYQLKETDLIKLKEWIKLAGIRLGENINENKWKNYNSWENGINRLLLGISLQSEMHWEEIIAINESYGLNAELSGILAKFMENLTAWHHFIQEAYVISEWKSRLMLLIEQFYQGNTENNVALFQLQQIIDNIFERMKQANFDEEIEIDIISTLFERELSEQRDQLNFLVGKVNFCTFLPMRAIPFKVVCLLGMNEGDFPRPYLKDHFDLMQYAPQKGDRAKRDDDRYLFLEALLSAQKIFYMSYIGQSIINNNEKLPSILVSQLIDYINENSQNGFSHKIIKHPISVFSKKNFTEHISYNKEWVNTKKPLNQKNKEILIDNKNGNIDTINITDLINYIQNPIKFFFNHRLGIKFETYETNFEISESFQLSNLEKYSLLHALSETEEDTYHNFFKNAKLKGELPACNFGKISETELSRLINLLNIKLSQYELNSAKNIEINITLEIYGKIIKLFGNIPNNINNRIILWRTGKLRDKDIIEAWIYYLILNVIHFNIDEFSFFYLNHSEVKTLQFNPIDQSIAKDQVMLYLQDYLSSFSKPQLVIYKNIHKYIKHVSTGSTPKNFYKEILAEDLYFCRILAQIEEINDNDIHLHTLLWFEKMINHIREKI